METRKFRVYNQTRKSFLGVEVILADTSREPLDTLIGNLALQAGEGLWLKPFREIPKDHALPLFGLIYLNQDYAVLQVVELYPGLGPEPMAAQAASALVLSVGAILASRTQPGDQLVIDAREQIETIPAAPPIQAAPEEEEQEAELPPEEPQLEDVSAYALPEAQETEPPPEEPQGEEVSAQPPLEVQHPASPHEEQKGERLSVLPPPDARAERLKRAIQQLNEREAAAQSSKKESLKTRFLRWLDADQKPSEPVDRRQARRTPLPGLVAFYWTGGNPHPYRIADVSDSGLYLITGDRSSPGTIFMLTLQRTDSDGEHLGDAISVYGEVVRWGADGVAFEFIPSKPSGYGRGYTLPGNPADEHTLIDFLERLNLPPR
ncbi:MAG: hypothetical protein KGM96_03625 [Acidobacteriota bacterium]|nr:hypothetical protein [Acidobacteriota bacterium]